MNSATCPPHSIEAEQSVLGGLMLDADAWDRVVDVVASDDFYRRDHRLIFTAIASLCQEGNPADAVTVSDRLARSGDLEAASGLAYVGALANNTPSAANIAAYAAIVRERAIERRLIGAGGRIAELARGAEPIAERLDRAQALLGEIAMSGAAGHGPLLARDGLGAVVDAIDARYRAGGALLGLSTGFVDLDQMLSGLQGGDLVVLAARPSVGKSAMAMQIAEHVAIDLKRPALVFSLEMSRAALLERIIASRARIDLQRLRLGRLDDGEWTRLTHAVMLLNDAPLLIDDSGQATVAEIRARARRVRRERGLDLVVVDYLQLVGGGGDTRAEVVGEISRGLKALAKELGVPVLALSQLNRALEGRNDRRPRLADLRESGSIEQDADTVVFLYRDDLYDDSAAPGVAELIVGKQRNGPIGNACLTFVGAHCRFDNYAGPARQAAAPRSRKWSGGFEG